MRPIKAQIKDALKQLDHYVVDMVTPTRSTYYVVCNNYDRDKATVWYVLRDSDHNANDTCMANHFPNIDICIDVDTNWMTVETVQRTIQNSLNGDDVNEFVKKQIAKVKQEIQLQNERIVLNNKDEYKYQMYNHLNRLHDRLSKLLDEAINIAMKD